MTGGYEKTRAHPEKNDYGYAYLIFRIITSTFVNKHSKSKIIAITVHFIALSGQI